MGHSERTQRESCVTATDLVPSLSLIITKQPRKIKAATKVEAGGR